MRCEKCDFENSIVASACESCGMALSPPKSPAKESGVVSSLAFFSFIAGLSACPLWLMGIGLTSSLMLSVAVIGGGLGILFSFVSLVGVMVAWREWRSVKWSILGILLGCLNLNLLAVNVLSALTLSFVAPVKGELRTTSIALDSFYLDHKAYPVWSLNQQENAFGGLIDRDKLSRLPTFRLQNGSSLATLTTPISYITSLYSDRFSPIRGATFCYWGTSGESPANPDGTGYIIWSPGPDGVYDLTMDNIAKLYVPTTGELSPGLLNLTYDPSNGATSRGDLIRTKE